MVPLKILIADDDHEIVNLISDALEDEGYETVKVFNGTMVLESIKANDIALIILDIMMPEMDGLEVCRKIRNDVPVPIIFLSAKSREMDKIVGLEIGADDYISKPFSVNELAARVKAHLRREKRSEVSEGNPMNLLKVGSIVINTESYEVFKDNRRVDLSTREFQIFCCFVKNKNRVLTREQIYKEVWGDNDFGDLNTVTVHIRNLRSKLDQQNELIKTVWGIGYKFVGGI